MSCDIYGEPLRRGHCEVHPHVHEEYPCSVCIADKRSREPQVVYKGRCESEHLLDLARERISEHLLDLAGEHIKELEQERDALAALCQEGAAVLERTANDTLDSRNMAVSLREAPTTSLAQLKAQWQAEALEHASDRVALAVEADTVRAHLRNQAAKLRRQAEGVRNDRAQH